MFKEIVSRTKRVPVVSFGLSGFTGEVMTRQLDSALMSVGWKLSPDLFRHLSTQSPLVVKNMADQLLPVVNELVGNHVKHNVYFKEFPKNIPEIGEFWMGLVREALQDAETASLVASQMKEGAVNLLDLPSYGKYLHSYEDMLKHHEEFIPSLKEKFKFLHLGGTLQEETVALYHQLAGSPVPLNEDDRKLISKLTEMCLDEKQPERFPVRENKAVVNAVRLSNKRSILADTLTDVLRLACSLSGGDVTLTENSKFKSFPRSVRRVLLGTISEVLRGNEQKLMDVNRYPEAWKRLGEKLHPHESNDPLVRDTFAVARGDKQVLSHAAKVEIALSKNDIEEAIELLSQTPGTLFRSLDRLINLISQHNDSVYLKDKLLTVVRACAGSVSGRVLIGVWEHLLNALNRPERRLFSNSKGKTWTMSEARTNLPLDVVNEFIFVIKRNLQLRFAEMGIDQLQIEPDALGIALPLSEKNKSSGFGVLPKGSVVPVHGENLRFFIHWQQKKERTDYDLSAFFMSENFTGAGHVSWTRLKDGDAIHSGDITSAPAPSGASEFIEMKLDKVKAPYIVAQVNRYAGENFEDIEESFFGFMERAEEQKGKPFEPKTVKVKSEVRGKGQVAIPALFFRDSSGSWKCKWLDFQLTGSPSMSTVEGNSVTTSMLMKAVVERRNLTIKDLADILPGATTPERMAYVGFQKPDNLEAGISKVFTLDNLTNLIPA